MKFVIHHHISRHSHYDFMIEEKDSLLTLKIEEDDFNMFISGKPVPAKMLPPHRKEYLTYEGNLTGDRGRVEMYDSGTCRKTEGDDILLSLDGDKVKGKVLIRKGGEEGYEIFFQKPLNNS